ncbi:winged helix-turn-helix domain-containing protein [Alteromonas ponticola]|nr:winged helix-turn-helix domain-containing protein [Alteromonas sp. ASW11-130]MCW8093286.1 winged helix-turn-helix domain-containing protein [Alteromonas sp. ASW11-130]
MAQQFWVNNYFVDVSRNQIQHQQQATQLPPKALKVLEVLASRAGEVVSHDELMELVWVNSVVGPNTLQRAIAQLRKVFGDDSKQQAFIKTHAKKGYSLEANVRWGNSQSTPTAVIDNRWWGLSHRKWAYAGTIAFTFVLLFYMLKPHTPLYAEMTPLTASDSQEYNASYSPNGRYLAFNRFVGQCQSHLWAKDLENNQEVRLSTEPGHYSRLSWSADGTQLAFIVESTCSPMTSPVHQCWQLQTFDFAQAWKGNSQNLLRYDCAETKTTQPTWLNDGRIAFLQYPNEAKNAPEIVLYDPFSEQLTPLKLDHQGEIYSLDYSHRSGLLAVVMLTDNHQHLLTTFTPQGEVHSASVIERLPHHSVYHRFPIRFLPDGNGFLTDVKGQIYKLNLDGELILLHPESYRDLQMPTHHPMRNKLTATYGAKDFDVGKLKIDYGEGIFEPFNRSTAAEINAQFQPHGNLIAFVSYRSGDSQIWIADGVSAYQLTDFEDGLFGYRFSWSPDGNSIVVNLGNQLAVLDLNGGYRLLNTPIAINALMSWHDPNHLLVTANQTKKGQLFSIDMRTGNAEYLEISNVIWASHTQDNQIIYSDYRKQFWLYADKNSHPMPKLTKKLFGKIALFKQGDLYGIDANHHFWRYRLSTDEFSIITTLDKNINYISDIRAEDILASKFIGGRRELIELSVDE